MQSFPTRLVGSVARSLLLAPCLLICLACATPFPLDTLKEGMTMEQATEAFGEPSSTNMGELHQAVQLLQKENARIYERLESAVGMSEARGPVARKLEELGTRTLRTLERLVAELDEASGEQDVRSTWVYPHFSWREILFPKEVELLFEGNKLVSWEMRLARFVPTSGGYSAPFPSSTFPTHTSHSRKDTRHHKRGHDHHH